VWWELVSEMIEKRTYVSEFTNRYGEKWIFEYDYATRKGILRGSDVDCQSYPILGGRALDLVLNNEEILWLRKEWATATAE
jgi:hypothetical protein